MYVSVTPVSALTGWEPGTISRLCKRGNACGPERILGHFSKGRIHFAAEGGSRQQRKSTRISGGECYSRLTVRIIDVGHDFPFSVGLLFPDAHVLAICRSGLPVLIDGL